MLDSPKEKADKAKVIKKLTSKWLTMKSTARKASLVLAKNPEIKALGIVKARKLLEQP